MKSGHSQTETESEAQPRQGAEWHRQDGCSILERDGRQRVLIADDDRDSRESLGELLSLAGRRIHYARNGAEALRLARTLRPDVVFLDIRMPLMNGYEVCHELRQSAELRSIRIFALSAEYGTDHERRCEQERFDAQLAKPLDIERLATIH